jgi:glycosyltransferase involved in cell wall biosynthesis
MKISIITPVYNGSLTIENTIKSIIYQSYDAVEYIVIDGGSTDSTIDIINKNSKYISFWLSEPDNGIYDALNKGMRMATGDIIGILHSDDIYADKLVLGKIANVFKDYNVDSCYGDMVYVDKINTDKIIRYWKSSPYRPGKFRYGWMPPHPTFFVKKEVYKKYGLFNQDFKISADYELMLRFLEKYRISTYYLPGILVKMRMGGVSNRSIRNLITKSSEDYLAWKINKLGGGLLIILLKNLSKFPQFINKGRFMDHLRIT